MTVEPGSLSFGRVNVGKTAEGIFTVRNKGGGQLVGKKATTKAPFSIVSGKTYNLASRIQINFFVLASLAYC